MIQGKTKRRTRLCIVLGGHWSAARGGAQFQANCIVDEVVQRGNADIFYLAHTTDPDYQAEGYRIIRIGSGKRVGRLGFLPDLLPLNRELVRLRPTVIYQRGRQAYTGVCALYAKRHGARFVFHVAHDYDVMRISPRYPRRHPARWAEWKISEFGLRRASSIVVQTQNQADILLREHGITASMLVRNFHPLPPADEISARAASSELRVIWVANFKPVKNPEVFVELAEAFRNTPGIQFTMIGRPGDQRSYSQLHERIRTLDNLIYLGELPIEQVNQKIAESDVFVNTSSSEGFPNTFVQAWLRGVPVVSCWVDPDGCLSEHHAGVLTGGKDGLAPAIEELRNNRDRLYELGRNAIAYGRARHSVEQAEPLIALLTQP